MIQRVIDITVRRTTVEVLVNPSFEMIMEMLHCRRGEFPLKVPNNICLRYMKNPTTGDIYIFEAFYACHKDVADALQRALGEDIGYIPLDGHNKGTIELGLNSEMIITDTIGRSYTVDHVLVEGGEKR